MPDDRRIATLVAFVSRLDEAVCRQGARSPLWCQPVPHVGEISKALPVGDPELVEHSLLGDGVQNPDDAGRVVSGGFSGFYQKCGDFENGDGERSGIEVSCSHLERPVDELNLSPNIRAAHPPHLSLPNHVHGLISLDCSPRRAKLAKPLFSLHPSFDRSMVLLRGSVSSPWDIGEYGLLAPGNDRADCGFRSSFA